MNVTDQTASATIATTRPLQLTTIQKLADELANQALRERPPTGPTWRSCCWPRPMTVPNDAASDRIKEARFPRRKTFHDYDMGRPAFSGHVD